MDKTLNIRSLLGILYWIVFVFAIMLIMDDSITFGFIIGIVGLLLMDQTGEKIKTFPKYRFNLSLIILTLFEINYYFIYWGNTTTSSQVVVLYLLPVIAIASLLVKVFMTKSVEVRLYKSYRTIDIVATFIMFFLSFALLQ